LPAAVSYSAISSTVLLVTHDRLFLDRFGPTRTLAL
jgi:ATPase subunit of ABC transporter with duplicated ATPase domains